MEDFRRTVAGLSLEKALGRGISEQMAFALSSEREDREEVFVFEIRKVGKDLALCHSAREVRSTSSTVIRSPRTHGFPLRLAGSSVIRSRTLMFREYGRHLRGASRRTPMPHLHYNPRRSMLPFRANRVPRTGVYHDRPATARRVELRRHVRRTRVDLDRANLRGRNHEVNFAII